MVRDRVGIIGLGHIGLALTQQLVKSGRSPLGYRRGDPSTFVERGGTAAASVAELVEACDTVLLVLPDIASSASIIEELISRAPGPTTIIDVTSQPPSRAIENAGQAYAKKHIYVEAPISGTPTTVEAGNGQFMVGARATAFDRVEPLLSTLAGQVLHVGDVGSASALKSATLLMMAINILGVAEGLAYATSFGVNPRAAVEALASGPAGSAALHHRGPWMAADDFAAKLGAMADFKGLLGNISSSSSTSINLFAEVLRYVDAGIDAGTWGEHRSGLIGNSARPGFRSAKIPLRISSRSSI